MGPDILSKPVAASIHWQRFSVPFEFPVVFTEALFQVENLSLRDAVCRLEPAKCHRMIFFVDEGVLDANPGLPGLIRAYMHHHSDAFDLVAAPIPVPGGEKIKSELRHTDEIQRQLFHHHIDRHSFVVAIGGGAVLDAVGYCAATAHRGLRHIRVPTTILAQDDSGVGVKNGVNLYGVKNFIGTFSPPFAVLNDIGFVLSLPERDKIAGMAEAVKVSLIRDAEFFAWLEQNSDRLVTFDRAALTYLIRRCAELHMHQIANGGDPFESGSARPLDYGHWAAHKLESLTQHELRHGEAVAIGMALDARYSVQAGLLPPGDEERICTLLEFLGFDLWHPAVMQRSSRGELALLEGLREFREHLGGELTVTLLQSIGAGVEVHEIDEPSMLKAIGWLQSRLDR